MNWQSAIVSRADGGIDIRVKSVPKFSTQLLMKAG
jgi:hypothetical protein